MHNHARRKQTMKALTQIRIGLWALAFGCGYAIYEVETSLVGFLIFGSMAIIVDATLREED